MEKLSAKPTASIPCVCGLGDIRPGQCLFEFASNITAALAPANEPYGIVKFGRMKSRRKYNRQCCINSLPALRTDLNGPNGNADLSYSHVLPELIRKVQEVKLHGDCSYRVRGSTTSKLGFPEVDELADVYLSKIQCVHLQEGLFHVGVGQVVTIREFAETVMAVVGFNDEIVFVASKPDCICAWELNVDRLCALGRKVQTALCDGIATFCADLSIKAIA